MDILELRTTPAKLDSAHASQHLQFTPSTRIMVLDNALAEEGVSPQAGGPLPSSQGEKANAGGYTMPDLSHLVFRPEFAVTRNIVSRGLNPFSGIVWKHAVARQVLSRADAVWAIEGRPITQDEFDAFTAADTTKLYWTDLGKPVGFGVTTAWLYYRRRAKLPPGITMTDHFRALWGLPRPDLMRQLFTTGFKLFFGVTASTIGFGMLGSYFFLNHMLTDPRLRDIAYQETDNRAARQEGIDTRKKILSAADRRYPFRHNNLRDRIIESLSSGSPVSLSKDDGGSTAGEVAPQGFNDYAQYQDISYGSDSEQQSSDNAWQPPAYNSTPQQAPQQSSGSDFFGDDDASPTAKEFRGTSITDSGSSTGSAWARIRQQNKPQRSAPQPVDSSDAPASAQDRYETEKNRDREQAQAEFDRLLDAERNASNDGSSQKGWWS